jgi:hypothetical protein
LAEEEILILHTDVFSPEALFQADTGKPVGCRFFPLDGTVQMNQSTIWFAGIERGDENLSVSASFLAGGGDAYSRQGY